MATTREQRQWAARYKLASTTLNGYAAAFVGAAFLKPISEGSSVGESSYFLMLAAGPLHFLALYLAGKGEP